MIVVDLFERLRGETGTWSTHERAEVNRLKTSFGEQLYDQIWAEGVTDAGDPWMVAVDHATDEMVLHLARVDEAYAILDRNLDVIARGPALRSVVTESLAHLSADSASRYGVRVTPELPVAMLAALLVDWLRVGGCCELTRPTGNEGEAPTSKDEASRLTLLQAEAEDKERDPGDDAETNDEVETAHDDEAAPAEAYAQAWSVPETESNAASAPAPSFDFDLPEITFDTAPLPFATAEADTPGGFEWAAADTFELAQAEDEIPTSEATEVPETFEIAAVLAAYLDTKIRVPNVDEPDGTPRIIEGVGLSSDLFLGAAVGDSLSPQVVGADALQALLDYFDVPAEVIEGILDDIVEANDTLIPEDGGETTDAVDPAGLSPSFTLDGFDFQPF